MNDELIVYRHREGSITSTSSSKNIKDFLESMSVFENYIELHTPEIFTNKHSR